MTGEAAQAEPAADVPRRPPVFDALSDQLRALTKALAAAPVPDARGDMIDQIRLLEELTCGAQARQARLTGAFDKAERAAQETAGVPVERLGRGVAEQVALARRTSPHRGRQLLSLARVARELPNAMAAFDAGLVTEWRMTLLARETACLSLADRLAVDEAVAGDALGFSGLSDRAVVAEAVKLAARLDPAAVARRRRRAESERCVTLRPAPDTMAYLTALLPVAQGVAAHVALSVRADRLRAQGDRRSRGQAMADLLVERIVQTGDASPSADVGTSGGAGTASGAGAGAGGAGERRFDPTSWYGWGQDSQRSRDVPVGHRQPHGCDESAAGDCQVGNDRGEIRGECGADAGGDACGAGRDPTCGEIRGECEEDAGGDACGAACDPTCGEISGEIGGGACGADGGVARDDARAEGGEGSCGDLDGDCSADAGSDAGRGSAAGTPAVAVSVGLVMTDAALLAGAHDDAAIAGHGPIPADLARELVLDALDSGQRVWLRRLYRHPESGQLVAMDSRQRLFPKQMAAFLRHRDQYCRTPWCDAPIRQSDHVVPAVDGGATSIADGQGLCQACNLAKQAPGWDHQPTIDPDTGHTVRVTTPTG
ncbi:MAG: HNH endonuclease, partial [Actinomycetia bacterium]|nr:HNH endonuclease [Actinomycetes bacterium]